MILLGLVLGVAVTALAATGVVGMAIYAAWVDDQRYTDEDCIP